MRLKSRPAIPESLLPKWQRIADLLARIMNVPAALIMRAEPPRIEVLVASATPGNPYRRGETAALGTGLYCESVMAQRAMLLVPDARRDPLWDHNPDLRMGMVSYLGYPIHWPDKEIFGTVCVLDARENPRLSGYAGLLAEFRGIIEDDLRLLLEHAKRERAIATAIALAKVGSFEYDPRRSVLEFSDETLWLLDWTGRDYPPVVGDLLRMVLREDRPRVRAALRRVVAQGRPSRCECRLMTASAVKHVRLIGKPEMDDEGRLVSISGAIMDITSGERTAAALEESRNQLRQLAVRLESVRERERSRIAREVHDEMGQMLTALKLEIENLLAETLGPDGDGAAKRLRDMTAQVDAGIHWVRKIATELRPGVLDSLGLAAAIRWQAEEFQLRTGVHCAVEEPPGELPITPEQATAVFRVFQEILTNVARHAQATAVWVRLKLRARSLTLEVRDNGKGIEARHLADPDSLGLLGMRERAFLLGGSMDFKGVAGKGTTVTLRLPRRAG